MITVVDLDELALVSPGAVGKLSLHGGGEPVAPDKPFAQLADSAVNAVLERVSCLEECVIRGNCCTGSLVVGIKARLCRNVLRWVRCSGGCARTP